MANSSPRSEQSEGSPQGAGAALLPNAASARAWKVVAGLFLLVGVFALAERFWVLISVLNARRTWPVADGQIVDASLKDDAQFSNRAGSVRGRTRYWVEYEVSFAVPAEICRTGLIYDSPGGAMPCHGIVRTRSTQSPSEATAWLRYGYQINQFVKVLWNPEGTRTTDIRIAGDPIGRGYNFGRLILSIVWVVGFGALYILLQRQSMLLRN